jgi:cytochrome c oxidase assembly protein subunit 11
MMNATLKKEPVKSRERMAIRLAAIALGMFAFGFALVPLYNLLCQVTGLQTAGSASRMMISAGTKFTESGGRWVTVRFDTTISKGLPWEFKPEVRKIRVRTGEPNDIVFIARNLSDENIIGQAIPNIVPWQVTDYFNKTECFCLQQQLLEPHQEKEMKLRFVVSPSLPENIETITLSYTLMNTGKDSAKNRLSGTNEGFLQPINKLALNTTLTALPETKIQHIQL